MHRRPDSSFAWNDQIVLVTGGTGSFGRRFIDALLRDHSPPKIIVFSRDELKQSEMRLDGYDAPNLRYFLGDVRDVQRLRRAMEDVTVVVHAAALKQVPSCEYNPAEAIKTNVDGSLNVIDAALDCSVERVVALSTDKAVSPVNLYGATKLVAEKLFVQGNAYSGQRPTRFSCVRYGNVIGSRGSVVPLFEKQRPLGKVTITDPRMTRFWITLEQGVQFVMQCVEQMQGGELFIPKLPSTNILDLASAVAPGCTVEEIGIRSGEKLHEVLLSEDEARKAVELDDMFVVLDGKTSSTNDWGGEPVADGFDYRSDRNETWLRGEELRDVLKQAQ
ncbi:MAG: UDP-N-acetylglucosamine 4,6-dehydratase (inverting) [Acidobacteria bacterium]|nr:UDP-N-acetylglucosamine 4,6-dehydratase (inverting) [Acidobacteriota bacterium]